MIFNKDFINGLTSMVNEELKKNITIYLKDKIDEKAFGDILIKEGLTKISIEMKKSEKSIVYNYFKFTDEINLANITPMCIIVLDADSSCIYIKIETISDMIKGIGGGLVKIGGVFVSNIVNAYKKEEDNANSEVGNELENTIPKKDFIDSMKEILFREKILDEVYDKSGEYENNQNKYEADTDDIIEKIDYNMGSRPHYEAFIIKHFIKYVMDKYKQEIS